MRIIGIVSGNAHPAGNQAPEEDVGIPDAGRHTRTNSNKQLLSYGVDSGQSAGINF